MLSLPSHSKILEIVLFLPGDSLLGGAAIAERAHVQVVVDVPQAVLDNRVQQFAVSQAIARPGLGQEVRRCRHVFRAAGDYHAGVAALDRLGGQHYGFHAGAADLVDRCRSHRRGQPGGDGGLAGDVLPQARPHDVAENHFIDLVRGQARAAQGFSDRHTSKVGAGTSARAPR